MTRREDLATGFDLYDPDQMRDIHATFASLRSECPVARSDRSDGFWMITRYDDVVAATLDTETFSSRYNLIPRDQFGAEFDKRPPLTLDPPEHTAFRRLLLPGFTTTQVRRSEPATRAVCREAIAGFIDRGECDASADYAKKIPLSVVCSMMGIPRSAEPEFTRWTHSLVEESKDRERMLQAAAELGAFLSDQIAEHETTDADDLISALMASEIDGQRLSRPELLGSLFLILLAGLDTVWATLGSCLVHLATHDEDRRRLVADPGLIPTAVEEFLRYFSPTSLGRVTTRSTAIGGSELAADEMVLICWPSANRDGAAFPDADKVIIDRQVNRHVAFGVGPHRCLGAAVARLELRVAIEEWLCAIPEYELTDPDGITYSTGHAWGPRNIAVRWRRG